MSMSFADFVTANGGSLTQEYYDRKLADREFNVMVRCMGSINYICDMPGCGQPLELKRNLQPTKPVPNPEADGEVPVGFPQPAKFIQVPSEKYGRYYFMCMDPLNCHPPHKDFRGKPTGKVDKDGKPVKALKYEPLGKFARGVPLAQFHPGIQAVFHNQMPDKGPYKLLSMTEQQIQELESGEVRWFTPMTLEAISAAAN